jgi:hypothetical protein
METNNQNIIIDNGKRTYSDMEYTPNNSISNIQNNPTSIVKKNRVISISKSRLQRIKVVLDNKYDEFIRKPISTLFNNEIHTNSIENTSGF